MPVLLSSEQLAQHVFPTPAYLVEPMIPQGGLAILHGKPGVGKTNLIASLAQAVNNGCDWLAKWPTRKGRVVVIQADMTGPIQQDRVTRIIQGAGIKDTFWVVEEDGSIPFLNIENMAVAQKDLVAAIRELDPLLIIWDTLRKIHRLPENNSETPIIVFERAREIAPHATHLFVHHNRKESRDPDAVDTSDEDLMGNQQWKGAVDATLSLKEVESCVPKRLMLTFHKARTAPDDQRRPVMLELDMKSITPVAVR